MSSDTVPQGPSGVGYESYRMCFKIESDFWTLKAFPENHGRIDAMRQGHPTAPPCLISRTPLQAFPLSPDTWQENMLGTAQEA